MGCSKQSEHETYSRLGVGYVQLEFEDLYIVGTYVPNSGENLKVSFPLCNTLEKDLTTSRAEYGTKGAVERRFYATFTRPRFQEADNMGWRFQLHPFQKR